MGRLFIFLSILGPGIISAFAGNDAGGTATYSVVGASFGYQMLWLLFISGFLLVVTQVMCARMGAVTGKGLSDLIREEFGLRWTVFAMFILLVANIAVTISEFAGIAASLEIFGFSRYIAVPLVSLLIWSLMVKGSYRSVEKVFIGVCLVYFSYIISGILAHPDWQAAVQGLFVPSFYLENDFLHLAIAMVGTTVAPWMQFYLQSSIVEKGVRMKRYAYMRWDVVIGSFAAILIAGFIIIACAATLNVHDIRIEKAEEAAYALIPFAGNYAAFLFALGLFASSALGASILPLSSSYAICEAFGWENGISKKFHEAPFFYWLYTFLILFGTLFVLLPGVSLLNIMLVSQTLNGVLLPVILIFILLLANNKRLMGEHVNHPLFNIVAWFGVVSLVLMSAMLFFL